MCVSLSGVDDRQYRIELTEGSEVLVVPVDG